MSQQWPSRKTKTTKKKTYAKPGTLSSLVQQRRTFLTTQETLQAVRLEKKNLLKSIEKEQPIAKQHRVAQLVEANEQCVEEQAIVDEQPIEEEQLQVDSTSTLPTNEQSEEQASDPSTQKNKRGTTQMQRVHGRNERKLILLNNNNQPVGPTNDVVLELSSFLGTLTRNATLFPLDILDWRYMDTKDDLWTYTQGKYDILEDAREWALDVIGSAWRRHKFELKKVCYKSCASEEKLKWQKGLLMFQNVNLRNSQNIGTLINTSYFQKMAETNTRNRKKLMNPHTAGKISFALVRNNLEEKKESIVSLKELFVVTRTRHPERSYKCSNEDTISKISEMEEIEKQQSVDGTDTADPFSSVMGPEHPGRLRLYGRGVTKTSLKRKAGNSEPIINATNDAVQQMQEKIQKMEEQMEVQRSTIQQDVTTNIIAQLQRTGLISADILAALCVPSPGEPTTAPQANHIICRPSTSSNNQESEGEQRDENNEGCTLGG